MKKIIAVMTLFICMLMLAACGGSDSGSSIPENPGNVYRVITCDESGAPVEGVKVQFCSDMMCLVGETDANGIASFETEEGAYTVHITDVPEGCAADDTEYPAPEKYGDVNITIKAAG